MAPFGPHEAPPVVSSLFGHAEMGPSWMWSTPLFSLPEKKVYSLMVAQLVKYPESKVLQPVYESIIFNTLFFHTNK